MQRQWILASGYLVTLLPPVLLTCGVLTELPYLAIGAVLLVIPLLRVVFGEMEGPPPDWHESVATALDRLPIVAGLVHTAAVLAVLIALQSGLLVSTGELIGAGLSLWITLLIATCPAHELIHRRSSTESRAGHWLAGLAGYPPLGFEHLGHHAAGHHATDIEWPAKEDSVWRFAGRRLKAVLTGAWQVASCSSMGGYPAACRRRLLQATAVSAVTALAFGLIGGVSGLLMYLASALGVAFGFQVITYLQHWGLRPVGGASDASPAIAWEDSCRFQAWLTLHVSFHQAHHDAARLPFYRLSLRPGSPRHPAGYVVLMVICLVPPLWTRLMTPVLDRWIANPGASVPRKRRLTCFVTATE